MALRTTFIASILITASLVTGSAYAALESRLGGQAVYDTDLNITWLANANLAATNTFGVVGIRDGVSFAPGQMQWNTAQSWIAAMNGANYLGFNDWRQPGTLQPDASCTANTGASYGYNCTGSEMGHLFYSEGLNNPNSSNYGLFSNVQVTYSSGTTYALDPNFAWSFGMGDGYQITSHKPNYDWVWAVRPGDVAAVPEADTWAMLLAGLGLVGVATRRRRE